MRDSKRLWTGPTPGHIAHRIDTSADGRASRVPPRLEAAAISLCSSAQQWWCLASAASDCCSSRCRARIHCDARPVRRVLVRSSTSRRSVDDDQRCSIGFGGGSNGGNRDVSGGSPRAMVSSARASATWTARDSGCLSAIDLGAVTKLLRDRLRGGSADWHASQVGCLRGAPIPREGGTPGSLPPVSEATPEGSAGLRPMDSSATSVPRGPTV